MPPPSLPSPLHPPLAHLLFAALVTLLVLAPSTHGEPGWRCKVCEDAVQTWHDQFRCTGEFLDWGPGGNSNIDGCKGPRLDCNKLGGALKLACLAMRKQFMSEALIHKKLWERMMLTVDAYGTCVELGKCAPDPTPETESECHKAFKNETCANNLACKLFTEHCAESCYLCNWIVLDWPLFQETCRPQGAALPASVPLPGDKAEASFLEITNEVRERLNARFRVAEHVRRQRRRATMQAQALITPSAAAEEEERLQRAASEGLRSQENNAAEGAPVSGLEPSVTPVRHHKDLPKFREMRLEEKNSIEMQAQAQTQTKAGARLEADAEMAAELQAGAGKQDEQQTELMTGYTLVETCFNEWNEIQQSNKAKYFASWKSHVAIQRTPMDVLKSRMWDANVVCKCLGKCPLQRFEDLGLLSACKYDAQDERMMSLLYKGVGDIHVDKPAEE